MKGILRQLDELQKIATLELFQEIFGESLGDHMWRKFINYNHVFPLYAMDNATIHLLEDYLISKLK